MNRNGIAYLVLLLDLRDGGAPRIVAAGTFGESCTSLTLRWKKGFSYCDAVQVEYGPTEFCKNYDDARGHIHDHVDSMGWDWCKKMLESETSIDDFLDGAG